MRVFKEVVFSKKARFFLLVLDAFGIYGLISPVNGFHRI